MTLELKDEEVRKTLADDAALTCHEARKHPVSQAEINRMVDDMMRKWFIGRQSVKVNFWDINMDWSLPGVLETITSHSFYWMPLYMMVKSLLPSSRFDFWKMVFENRKSVPMGDLLSVWYGCLADWEICSFQQVATPDGIEEFTANVSDPEMQRHSVITDPLLIDDPIVCFRYCQVQKPGWEMLRYIHGRRLQALKLSDAMRQALREDHLPVFAIHMDMSRRNVSFSLLAEVLNNGAVSIFRYLMEKGMVTDDIIPLPELCCFLAARFQDNVSVPMLAILEELYPGLIRSVTDVFGRNLLWYAVQNMKTGWFHPDCKLTPFLLEHGCDPQNVNQIGLPWQMITNELTMKFKKQLMRKRYNMENYRAVKPYLLLQNQPLDHLNA